MSSTEPDVGLENALRQAKNCERLKFPGTREFKLAKETSIEPTTVKKRRVAVDGKSAKVCKPGPVTRTLRPTSKCQNKKNDRRKTETKACKPSKQDQSTNPNSFYQGALLGSFLGATLTTVVANLVTKAFQNN